MTSLPNVTSDTQGSWEWDHAQWPDIHSARIAAKGYKSEMISFTLPGHFETVLKRSDVISIIGSVVNLEGRPVEGAIVRIASMQDYVAKPNELSSLTDAQGRFELSRPPGSKISLRAVAPDGSAGWLAPVEVGPGLATQELKIVIRPSNSSRVFRVKDEDGGPVAAAQIRLTSWEQSQIVTWSSETDPEGIARWESAPEGRLVTVTTKEGFCPHWSVIESNSEESSESPIEVVLQKPMSVRALVVDAVTSEPIPDFYFHAQFKRAIEARLPEERWEKDYLKERYMLSGIAHGKNGQLESNVQTEFHSMSVSVTAPGYLTQKNVVIADDFISEPRTIRLERARRGLEASDAYPFVVHNPDGSPADGAQAMVLAANTSTSLAMKIEDIIQAKLFESTQIAYSCDGRGQVAFANVTPTSSTIIFWNDQGIAIVPLQEWTEGEPIRLQPYAKLRLRLSPSMYSPIRFLALSRSLSASPNETTAVSVNLDWENRSTEIECTHVLPGRIQLIDRQRSSFAVGASQTLLFEFDAEPGQEYEINLEGNNRMVGRIDALDPESLTEPLLLQAMAVDEHDRTRVHEAVVQRDGTFAFEGVGPGEYEISVVDVPESMLMMNQVGGLMPSTRPKYVASGYASFEGENQTIDLGDLPVTRTKVRTR